MKPLLTVLLLTLLCLACARNDNTGQQRQSQTLHASTLSITRAGNTTIAKVTDPKAAGKVIATYIFADTDTTQVIADQGCTVLYPKDLKRLMVYSSVHAAALKELGCIDRVKVVGDAQYFTIPEINIGLKEGSIADGGTQQQPVVERIMKLAPGAILISYYEGMDASAVKRLGIPVIYLCESMEESPLGRAEWIKMLGLIAGQRERSDSIFRTVKSNYDALQMKTANVQTRPKVMMETMYQGVWSVAGGKSYAARMIADAGGDYPWKDNASTGSLNLPFESVLAKAADSDIWLIRIFGSDLSLDYLRAADERYMLFAPTNFATDKNKELWGCNTVATPFYEETPFHPDRLLGDYIYIFHPKLMPAYTPRYFKKVTH